MPPKCDSKMAADEPLVETTERNQGYNRTRIYDVLIFPFLERILAANTQTFLAASKASMSSLLASLPTSSSAPVATVSDAATSSAPASIKSQVKVPKWSDDDTPFRILCQI